MRPDDLTPDCGRIRGELPGLLYGELPPDSRAALERHLEACAPCREELAALRDTQRLLSHWETPPAGEDPRQLARAIAEQARTEAAASSRAPRARLLRWTALASGAAAALLFTLSLLGTSVRYGGGRLEIGFALPGARAGAAHLDAALEERLRAIAAQEVAARAQGLEASRDELVRLCSDLTQQELFRLSQAVDLARAQDQQLWEDRYATLSLQAARADREQRRVITDLAALIPVSNR